MVKHKKIIPTAEESERAERLRGVLEAISEVNRLVPVIVEGKRDAAALRKLGLEGGIITLHNGRPLYDFCEDIAVRFDRVVLLMDWDPTGEGLLREIGGNLRGLWEEFSAFRELLKILCQKDIMDIEGIPKLLRRLEGEE
ncbi:MAG: hypothetical protein Q8J64_07900 [Thermodesulfovibrionales bacterium]|nr:hypothetical protein [Thermodesulfovibrionales bacterium]